MLVRSNYEFASASPERHYELREQMELTMHLGVEIKLFSLNQHR